jgi:ABC-type multidrug transport system ATPase subunit
VAVLQQGHILALGTPSQLARNIVAEIRLKLEIDSEQAKLVHGILTRFTDDAPVLNASGLAVAGILREQIPQVVAKLVEEGVRLYRVDHDEPTLEDVYFALHTTAPLVAGQQREGHLNGQINSQVNGTGQATSEAATLELQKRDRA